jgi:hypothetical protein
VGFARSGVPGEDYELVERRQYFLEIWGDCIELTGMVAAVKKEKLL